MAVLVMYTVLTILSVIIGILALDSCSDTGNNCQYCGATNYPIEVAYRQSCMKKCGVCSDINVALDKPTKQSSTLYYGTINSNSSNAVDGNTDSDWFHGHCTHTTKNTSHWWCVDLKQIYNIDNIKVFNRNQTQCTTGYYSTLHSTCQPCNTCLNDRCDPNTGVCTAGCKDIYHGDKCTTPCSDKCTNSRCSTTSSSSSPQCTDGCVDGYTGFYCQSTCPDNCVGGCGKIDGRCHDCTPDTVGPYCNLTCGKECQQRADQSAITCDKDGRCTDCIVGKTGDRCDMNCSTTCDGGCDRYNGKCVTCIKGKTGDKCNINCNDNCTVCNQNNINSCTECIDGKWGQSCYRQCNTNCKSVVGTTVSKCNITTGLCSKGCKLGIYGTDCNTDCSSYCKDGSCHQTTGNCTNGCLPGKIGYNCTTDCEPGMYGEKCKSKCGNCAQNISCDILDGSCGLTGCADGFQGQACHLKTESTTETDNMTTVIGSVVAAMVVITVIGVVIILLVRRRRRQKSMESNQLEVNHSHLVSSVNNNDSASKNTAPTVTEKPNVKGNTYTNLLAEDENEGAQIYVNVDEPTEASTRITLKNLLHYIEQRKTETESLKAEFQTLPSGLCSAYDYCMNTVNKPKNRYKNICAFDHSRVKLDIENDDPNSDYINACCITGYGDIENKYIASQGPVDVIIKEFLRLLWVSETGKIVMLTNLVEMGNKKCFKYWPNSGKQMKFGKISMALINEDIFSHFTVRTFKITKDECGSRTIKQYHYTSWPDKGVPTDTASLVEFRNKVIKAASPQPGPMVVHCSAGIGRTGTFIALDYSIEEAKAEGSVDIFECVKQLRYERVNMVQTWEQYVFLHDALAEWYVAGDITFPVTSYQQDYQALLKVGGSSGKSQLQERFEMLDSICPSPTTAEFSVALSEENKEKNRDLSVLASDKMRLCLFKPQMTDYINALFLSSYRKKRAYILTQAPLPNTVVDFWTMVVERDVTTIVNMDITGTTSDIGQYVPTTGDLICGPFNISKIDETKHENGIYTVVTCLINSELDESLQRRIRIYQCNFWNPKTGVPQSAGPIFTILEDIKSCSEQDEDGPIIVHCLNGVEKSGIFCVLAAILERLTIEQDVSILQTLVQLRVSRPQIITSFEQLRFCFDAVGEYLDEFSVYANSC
ncbi:receptor-type tyrosine-protein phosphatase mu [Patella vulgata]|uniref:receptor-type tyrosine-protein phosphatase mu n=1 Tax=Patella vulgata TaxID=6465 RepID=UPI0024A8FF17|nr:receptor-type tyrosine-protein phosphatase mu [Patella vulgata]